MMDRQLVMCQEEKHTREGTETGILCYREQLNRSHEDIREKSILGLRGQPARRPLAGDMLGVVEGQQEGHWAAAE